MIAASYMISRLQDSAYHRYREAHPAVYRPALHRAKWLHRLGLVAIAVLILFYFVPTATWFIGVRVFVSGPAYWLLAVVLTLLPGLASRLYYRGQLAETPPPAEVAGRVATNKAAPPTGPPAEPATPGPHNPSA